MVLLNRKAGVAVLIGLILGFLVLLIQRDCSRPVYDLGNQTSVSTQHQKAAHQVAAQVTREKHDPKEFYTTIEEQKEGRVLAFHLRYIGDQTKENAPAHEEYIVLYDTVLDKTSKMTVFTPAPPPDPETE